MGGSLHDALEAWRVWDTGYGEAAVVSVTETAHVLELRLRFPKSDDAADHYIVRCEAVRNHEVHPAEIEEEIRLLDEHELLLEHQAERVTLTFTGTADDTLSMVGALYVAHVDAVGSWYPFERFLNPEMDLVGLLQSGYGQLAEGPEPLIEAYERVLNRYDIRTSRLTPRPPVWWDGEEWTPGGEGVRVLFLDDMYVVAQNFSGSKE
jgi:hypothetical protein